MRDMARGGPERPPRCYRNASFMLASAAARFDAMKDKSPNREDA